MSESEGDNAKRDHVSDSSDSDHFVGPSLPPPAKRKKIKILPHERLYLDNLPSAEAYERSYMHRDVITHCVVTSSDFIITASCDGHVKFWKKVEQGIEFVKHFRSHLGPITHITSNVRGSLLCTASLDKSLKMFDILNFDMINMMRLEYVPNVVEWIHGPGDPISTLAVADADSSKIYVYDGLGVNKPLKVLDKLHSSCVILIKYNTRFDVAISVDKKGIFG